MSTVERIQASVMGGLLRGEYGPGTWLRQDELAEDLAVSKIPVREALHRLAAVGLLRFEPNRGVVVPHLTAPEAEEIFALRRGIEPRLLERAFERFSIVHLAEAREALGPGDRSPTEANWAFHRSLYRSSGWDRGLAMAEMLHVAVAPYVILYTEGLGGAEVSDAEHVAILAACERGDRPTALAELNRHLDHAERSLVTFLQADEA